MRIGLCRRGRGEGKGGKVLRDSIWAGVKGMGPKQIRGVGIITSFESALKAQSERRGWWEGADGGGCW